MDICFESQACPGTLRRQDSSSVATACSSMCTPGRWQPAALQPGHLIEGWLRFRRGAEPTHLDWTAPNRATTWKRVFFWWELPGTRPSGGPDQGAGPRAWCPDVRRRVDAGKSIHRPGLQRVGTGPQVSRPRLPVHQLGRLAGRNGSVTAQPQQRRLDRCGGNQGGLHRRASHRGELLRHARLLEDAAQL